MSSKPSSFISSTTEKATGENAALTRKLQTAAADFGDALRHAVYAKKGPEVVTTALESGRPKTP